MSARQRLAVATPAPHASTLPDPEVQPLLRVEDLIGFVPGMGRSALYDAAAAGELPTIRLRGKLYIPTGELRRLWGVDITTSAADTSDGAA